MENQLQLLEVPSDWHLDEETKAIGRQGVEAARAALEQAHREARSTGDRRAA
jgi:hypothetical protein